MTGPPLVLDISRTLSRALHAVPTGIDRVELAYADWLLRHHPDRVRFAAVHPLGSFSTLPGPLARDFIGGIGERWRTRGAVDGALATEVRRLAARISRHALRGAVWPGRRADGVYLLTSHHHLDRPRLVAAMRRHYGRLACFIHDLIPIEWPEYARPGVPARHAARMRTAAELSDHVFTNSDDTTRAFGACVRAAGRAIPVRTVPLGVDASLRAPPPAGVDAPPLFVCVATIEPRKNHLLLLQVWRQLAAALGADTPRLVLVGRRGWENENVIDLLDRCPALRDCVTERNALSDRELGALFGQARALLLPSFAEGYGLPIAEALAAGLPVLCSDLPAFREVGGEVPEYLHPLDGLGWLRAVADYAEAASPRRRAQSARLARWSPPNWDTHMRTVVTALDAPSD